MNTCNLTTDPQNLYCLGRSFIQKIPKSATVLLLAALVAFSSQRSMAQDRQSPIDFNPRDVVLGPALPRITANYSSSADLKVVHTWAPPFLPELKKFSTVKALVSGVNGLSLDGTNYTLVEFHFHTPSEHTANGADTPMEVHFVHLQDGKNLGDPDALFVIGAWILPGSRNAEFDKIFAHLPQPGDPPLTISNFNLAQILPSLLRSFRYPGALTAPAALPGFPPIEEQIESDIFPENVRWVVVRDFIHMSPTQIAAFQALFPEPHGNARPTQLMAGRIVNASVQPK